jgi:DNA mismatch endonuclease (patch repair protein)
MRAVAQKNTGPELKVRRRLHALGYRFRLHRRDLPGTPDIVLPRYKAVILVHGCFWHQHPGCRRAARPQTRQGYWLPKLDRNVARDAAALAALETLGWRVLVVWECELRASKEIDAVLQEFIGHPTAHGGAEGLIESDPSRNTATASRKR